jgi:phage recombination protein Bet
MTQAVAQFNDTQMRLIRETVAKGTNEAEFRLFIEVCQYHRLNPFARQIYAVVRDGFQGRQMSIQTSIDGYRLLAERSGKYAGQDGPQWCGEDGEWKDVWLSDKPPVAARVGVLRNDFKMPVWGVAKYKSYVQTKKAGEPTTMWAKMPDVMLAKCAESLALRKAFPAEMSGIYTREEMEQADNDLPTVDHAAPIVDAEPVTTESHQPAQPAPRPTAESMNVANAPINSGQLSGIKDLCGKLGCAVPANVQTLGNMEAAGLIQQLTSKWNVVQRNRANNREKVGAK